uniref:Extracellular globin n=1 Tax=Sabellastarte spectabilis TaxID=880618 RepID=Q26506_9ANNE|nr:a polypeptide chain of chlorocruorin [Sabellastarte spectabilis]
MFRLCYPVCFVAYASCESCCSMEDRQEVLKAWETMWSAEFTGRRVTIAQEVFDGLFKKNAATKDLFKNVNVDDPSSAEFRAHCVRVTNGLDTIINMAFDSDALAQQLIHLAAQHAKYDGMKAEYLALFRESFAEVLPQAVPCFNSAAWNRCIAAMHEEIGSQLAA